MSILVSQLTKQYGSQKAIDSLSFELRPGEIVGFLGPNGARKSTTMKLLTGYLKPTEGRAVVNGHDLANDAMQARRSVGYLAEHNPLYLDMYVREFLLFVGKIYGMKGKSLKVRVEEMVQLCGLNVEQHKQIGQLSKGYRQRVGCLLYTSRCV